MANTVIEKRRETATLLRARQGEKLDMLIGVDGFVDEIIHVVDKRHDAERFDRVETIAHYGEKILRAAGLSTNIEYVSVLEKLGGNGPIFANALLEFGVGVVYVGSLGYPDIHPVFRPLAERASAVYSLTEPGRTDAVEFYDGKLIIGKHQSLKELTWENFSRALGGPAQIAEMIAKCALLGMENWTMVPYMNKIWDGLIDEVFPLLPDKAQKPIAFFDLADPEKRTDQDLRAALLQIARFEEKFRVVLGLNEKELYRIAALFDIHPDLTRSEAERLKLATEATYQKLDMHCLVVHPIRFAVACTEAGIFHADGPYCENPVLSTGAGDNFNAGFCMAYALGLGVEQSLLAGVSTSGFYVRQARSPALDEVIAFLEAWE